MHDSLIGVHLGNYRIERALGRGGMARVYRGHDLALNRPVAIKVIEPGLREIGSYAARFQQEAQAIAALEHPHIVPVYYFGKQENLYYLVMKFIEGEDLAALLERYAGRGELLPVQNILGITQAVGDALDYAHRRGVIHRDVKPSNVMVDVDGRPYLTDFGLALDVSRGTVGEVLGTPHYVAPEQARNSAQAVPQSDLYSLGVMLFEMFTGVVPFDGPTPTAIALQHIMQEPPPPRAVNPNLAPAIENVILRALAKSPEERYPTGAALTAALQQALQGAGETPATASTLPPLPPLPPGFTPPPPRRTATRAIAEEVRTSLATRQPEPPPPSAPHRPPGRAAAPRQAPQATASPARPPRSRWPFIAIGLLAAGAVILVAVMALAGQPGQTATQVPQALQLPSATPPPPQTDIPPGPTSEPTATATTQPSQTPMPSATWTAQPTTTPPPPTSTPLPPTDAPSPTAMPQAIGPTPAPADWLPVRFVYNADAFYWLNDAGRNISAQHIAFERIGGGQHFEGNRWAYWTMEAGRCMEVVFADVSFPPRPQGCRPNAWFTPTRTQNVDFWTGSGQFRVLWRGQEIAVCEISAGQCHAFVPPA